MGFYLDIIKRLEKNATKLCFLELGKINFIFTMVNVEEPQYPLLISKSWNPVCLESFNSKSQENSKNKVEKMYE